MHTQAHAHTHHPPNHDPQVFVTAHQSVEETSKKMFEQLKRRNYVTATNYLETVRAAGHSHPGSSRLI